MRPAGVRGCGFPYPSGSGSSGISATILVPCSGGLSTVERSLERCDTVGEAPEPRTVGRVGPADAVVGHLDTGARLVGADANVDDRGAGVLDHVGERLRDHVVRGGLDGLRQLDRGRVDLDGDRQSGGERLERRGEAPVGEDGRMDAAGELAQLVESGGELLACGLEHRLGRRRVALDLRLGQAQRE